MRVVCVDYNAPNEFLTMIAVVENSRMRKEQLKRGDSVVGVAMRYYTRGKHHAKCKKMVGAVYLSTGTDIRQDVGLIRLYVPGTA